MSALELVVAPSYDDFVREHTPRLQRLARRRLSDSGDAEEVVQETLLRLHAHWAEFSTAEGAAAWTTTVASRLVVDRLRVAGRSVPVPELAEGVRLTPDTADVVVARHEARLALDALEALPPRQASVLWAREVEGLSYDAIAERHGLTEPSVRSLLLRGRKGLRREYAMRGGTAPAGALGALGIVVPMSPALDALRGLARLRKAASASAASAAAVLGMVAVAVLSVPTSPAPVVAPAVGRTAAPSVAAARPAVAPVAPAAAVVPVGSVRVAAAGPPALPPSRGLPGACLGALACLDGNVTDADRANAIATLPLPQNPLGLEEVGVSTDVLTRPRPAPVQSLLPALPENEDPLR